MCPMPGAVPRRMAHACHIHAVLDPTPVISWPLRLLLIDYGIACSICHDYYNVTCSREKPMNASLETHSRSHFLTVGFRRCHERSSLASEMMIMLSVFNTFCRWSSLIIARDRVGYLMPCFVSSCKNFSDSCIY